jgi:hypothetical protein
MSTKDVPLLRPTSAYSLPVVGSVQPHTSLPEPPPMSAGGMTAIRSTFEQG